MHYQQVNSGTDPSKVKVIFQLILKILQSGFFISGVLIALLVWLIDPIIDVKLYGKPSFLDALLNPDSHEIYLRSLVSIAVLFYSFITALVINRYEERKTELIQATNLLETFINASEDLIFLKDSSLRTVLCNEAFARCLGKEPEELYGKSDIENGWPADHVYGNKKLGARGHIDDDNDVLSGKTLRINSELASVSGETRYFETIKTPYLNGAGDIIGVLAVARDITDRNKVAEAIKENELKLKESLELFHASFDEAPIGMALVAEDQSIVEANQSLCDMLGYTVDELLGKNFRDLTHKDDLEKNNDNYLKLIEKELSHYGVQIRYIHKSREILWADLSISALKTQQSQSFAIAQIQDITEKKQAAELLTYQASHDELTGLVNRREFERRIERLLKTVRDDKETQHALCFMDLDQFKVVNDNCGHVAGDELLRQISSLLKRVIRHRDTLARLGGDEFGLLMEHCSLDDAHRVATTLQKAIHDYSFHWQGNAFKVGVSIGLVPITHNIPSLNELLKEADAACYMAKENGRNRIHIYHQEDAEISRRHGEMQWVSQLYKALDENRFCLYLQKIVPFERNEPVLYEVLIRMIDVDGSIVFPNAFLPAAERYNLISKIDLWVIEKTFQLMRNCREIKESNINLSINLSGLTLSDSNVLEFILEQFKQTGINGNKICFEVTETAAIVNLDNATRFFEKLKEIGCQFALDDFGSGLSSFAYLKNLPINYLKIDGAFVQDIAEDPIDHAMVKSINEVGQVMGMKTIAEFVENDMVKGMLREIGVNFVQGYGIGRPEPFENLFSVEPA